MNLILGDCLEELKKMPENSVDALVTDPPYGIRFMGKAWDGKDIVKAAGSARITSKIDGKERKPRVDMASEAGKYNREYEGMIAFEEWTRTWAIEVFRVLKPGAHALVFAAPRSYHRMACGMEDAGFEVRDQIQWLFGQGFPKSLNIEKQGLENWKGWGTALKPANEPILLARKSISEKNIAHNVLKWGCGGLNIDGCRIEAPPRIVKTGNSNSRGIETMNSYAPGDGAYKTETSGRFPANLLLSHSPNCTEDACDLFDCAVNMLDEQSGYSKACNRRPSIGGYQDKYVGGKVKKPVLRQDHSYDSGGASRFFYCAKISPGERNAGLDGMPNVRIEGDLSLRSSGIHGETGKPNKPIVSKNHHPTVKPQKLMRYLCRLVTPPNGLILDPFMGSGSTGLAARSEGFGFIGIEKEPEYFEIAKARIENARA